MLPPLKKSKKVKYQPTAASISDEEIVAIAPEIIARQRREIIMPRELAASLNDDLVTHPREGRRWNHTCVYLLMKRGVDLGLPFVRRDRGEASSRRRVVRRPRDVIAAERAANFAAAEAVLTNPGITASGPSAMSAQVASATEAAALADLG